MELSECETLEELITDFICRRFGYCDMRVQKIGRGRLLGAEHIDLFITLNPIKKEEQNEGIVGIHTYKVG